MSEKPSTNAGRLDNWDANKLAHERNQWEDALYAEAGKTEFDDNARKRAEEAQAYEDYMSSLAKRSSDHDTIAEDRLDAIDRTIQGDTKLRRMVMMANQVREAAEHQPGADDDAERMMDSLRDKEDKLQELLEDYMENGQASEHEKDEIMNRIIGMTRGETLAADQVDDNSQTETVFDSDEQQGQAEAEEYTGRHRGEAEPTGEDAAEAEEYTGRHRGGKSEAEEYTGRHRGEAEPTGEDAAEAEEYTGRHRAAEGSDLSGEEINTDWVDGHVDGELELLADDGAEEINTDWVDEYVDNERELLAGARGWARRHWALLRRSGGLGNYAGGELHTWMSSRRNPNHEKTKDKRKWIAGFLGGAAVLLAGALLIRSNQHELATTIGSGSGVPGGSGGNTLTNDAAGLTGALETPHGEMPEMPVAPDAVPDVADIDSYRYPWNWAADVFGREDATSKLRDLVEAARADGIDIKWNGLGDGNDKNNWISINGNSDSKFVIETLDQYR